MSSLETSRKKSSRQSRARLGLVIGLILCLFSMILQSLLQTNFGKVDIQQIVTVTANGYKHTATLYVPENATPETPAPAVLMAHGSWKAREIMSGYAVELARRGYVVYNYDQYGMGDSEPVDKRSYDARDALELVAQLSYVNPEQIGITGHSSGARVGDMLCKQLEAEGSDLQFASIILVDNDPYYKNDDGEYVNNYGSVNYGVVACQYDDWFFSVQNDAGEWIVRPRDYITSDNCKSFLSFGQDPSAFEGTPEAGKYYSAVIDGEEAVRVVYTPNEIHTWGSISPESISYVVEFFQTTMPAPNPIEPSGSYGFFKEIVSLVGMVGLMVFMVYFVISMLYTPFFSVLRSDELVQPAPAPVGLKGKLWFWGGLILGAVFSYFAFQWFMRPIYDIPNTDWPALLPQQQTLAVGVWGLSTGLFTIIVMILNYKLNLKPNGFDLAERGVTLKKNQIVKTILLALIAVAAVEGILFFADFFFDTNFQFWATVFRTFDGNKVPIMLCALPLFLMFYVPNSVVCNSFRYNGIFKGGWLNTLVIALFNVGSILFIEILQYGVFFATGQPFWYATSFDRQLGSWLIGTLVVVFVTPWISRKIYKETRNPYLGGIINAIIVTILNVTLTITYLPVN